MRARLEVLLDGHLGEDPPALHDLRDAALHHVGRVRAGQVALRDVDAALGDLAAVGDEQARDRPQQRGLAGPVRAEQRHDRTVGNLQGQAPQDQHHVVVDNLEVVDRQDRHRRAPQ
jgi:hypothetical protein